MVGPGYAERRQRDCPHHCEPFSWRSWPSRDGLADVHAELTHGHGAQLDLAAAIDRMSAGCGRLDRAAVPLHAEDGDNFAAAPRDGADAELSPASHFRLAIDQVGQGSGSPVAVAAFSLDP